VVEFADVRVLAFGVLNKAGTMFLNSNAHEFLHPVGIDRYDQLDANSNSRMPHGLPKQNRDPGMAPNPSRTLFQALSRSLTYVGVIEFRSMFPNYARLTHPIPSLSHSDYPFHTPGGRDKRWVGSAESEEEGLQWVGGLMSVMRDLQTFVAAG
jgi:hypothetical protein